MERTATVADIAIYDDFAHHPTAVRRSIAAMKRRYPGQRIVVAIEPRSNTTRRNIFQAEHPVAMLKAVRSVVHDGEKPEKSGDGEKPEHDDEEDDEVHGKGALAVGLDDTLLIGLERSRQVAILAQELEVVARLRAVGVDRIEADLPGAELGRASPPGHGVDAGALDGNNGFAIPPIDSFAEFGRSVAGAGDVNGDGFGDVIIGAPYAAGISVVAVPKSIMRRSSSG